MLQKLFEVYGPIIKCTLVKRNRKSLGYGFVLYQHPGDAEKAIAARHQSDVGGKVLKVAYAHPSDTIEKACKLLLEHVPNSYQDGELRDLLANVWK